LSVIAEENAGVVAGLTGHADDGAKIELEMLLLPLARLGHAREPEVEQPHRDSVAVGELELGFVNEYLTAESGGERLAPFPGGRHGQRLAARPGAKVEDVGALLDLVAGHGHARPEGGGGPPGGGGLRRHRGCRLGP